MLGLQGVSLGVRHLKSLVVRRGGKRDYAKGKRERIGRPGESARTAGRGNEGGETFTMGAMVSGELARGASPSETHRSNCLRPGQLLWSALRGGTAASQPPSPSEHLDRQGSFECALQLPLRSSAPPRVLGQQRQQAWLSYEVRRSVSRVKYGSASVVLA